MEVLARALDGSLDDLVVVRTGAVTVRVRIDVLEVVEEMVEFVDALAFGLDVNRPGGGVYECGRVSPEDIFLRAAVRLLYDIDDRALEITLELRSHAAASPVQHHWKFLLAMRSKGGNTF